jgi:hypothetical protein
MFPIRFAIVSSPIVTSFDKQSIDYSRMINPFRDCALQTFRLSQMRTSASLVVLVNGLYGNQRDWDMFGAVLEQAHGQLAESSRTVRADNRAIS